MHSNLKKIKNRLSNVGSPVFMYHLLNDTVSFIKEHQSEYPCNEEVKKAYIVIGESKFILQEQKISGFSEIYPTGCPLITMSKENYLELMSFLGESNTKIDLKRLIQLLRKVDNIKKYKEIMGIISNSFSTNMSVIQLSRLVVQQI